MIDAKRSGGRSGKKNIWLSLAAIYGVSAILGMGTYYGYRYYCESINDGFLKGTLVDGEDISGLSVDEAQKLIHDKYADSEIIITENENEDLKGNLAFYGYEVDQDKLRQDLQAALVSLTGLNMRSRRVRRKTKKYLRSWSEQTAWRSQDILQRMPLFIMMRIRDLWS